MLCEKKIFFFEFLVLDDGHFPASHQQGNVCFQKTQHLIFEKLLSSETFLGGKRIRVHARHFKGDVKVPQPPLLFTGTWS